MMSGPTVCIDNNLSASQSAVSMRAADHESASRIHQKLCVGCDHIFRQNGLDDFFNHSFTDRLMINVIEVLGG